ncbi:MAG: metallophosphoesterase [Promethearchaeota archaeon]
MSLPVDSTFSFRPQPEFIEGPVVVVGDVHGQLEKLLNLWDKLEGTVGDFAARTIVFIGDYVDRGPDVRETVEWLVELRRSRREAVFTCGNHDLALGCFLGLFPPPPGTSYREAVDQYPRQEELWTGSPDEEMHLQGRRYPKIYESESTFASYGAPHGDRDGLLGAMPREHVEFFRDLPWVVEHPDFLFVHAGLEIGVPVAEQLGRLHARDLSQPRVEPIQGKHLRGVPPEERRVVVSGHVRVDRVVFRERRVLLDTSGGREGPVSAVLLPERLVLQSTIR